VSYSRLKSFSMPLPISLGEGANHPTISSRSSSGSISVFFVVLLSCTTVSTGPSGLRTGLMELLIPIVCVFSLPIWVLAATFGPPPVRRLRGVPLQLAISIKAESSSSKREYGPDEYLYDFCIFNLNYIN
jgi:hypothetical protein